MGKDCVTPVPLAEWSDLQASDYLVRPVFRTKGRHQDEVWGTVTLSAKTSADQSALVGASSGLLRLSQLAKWAILTPKRRSKRLIPTSM
jgi:hypothetical protein